MIQITSDDVWDRQSNSTAIASDQNHAMNSSTEFEDSRIESTGTLNAEDEDSFTANESTIEDGKEREPPTATGPAYEKLAQKNP